MKPPFPYFGGKSRIADWVWPRLNGDGKAYSYTEPFFGSGAMLLANPNPMSIEVVNDLDGMVCNFWRALQSDPDAVADAAIWPCNELDLHARGDWLIGQRESLTERLRADPTYHDPQAAGWWAWGMAWWIGSGWAMPTSDGKNGRRRPSIGNRGEGLARKRPHLGNTGEGLARQRPHLGFGEGLARQLPHLGNAGKDDPMDMNGTRDYLRVLAERLRYVRVCCGDWARVLTAGAMACAKGRIKVVFLDPPYAKSIRDADCYAVDTDPAQAVAAWAREHGSDPEYRIALCGYEGEHEMPAWGKVGYKAAASYQTASTAGKEVGNNANRKLERVWFSPHCLGELPLIGD